MKVFPSIVGAALGLFFVAISAMYFFDMMPEPDPPPAGSAQAHFWAAFGPTGYMNFVKTCELGGGLLTAIPRTRVWGILILTPIVANIFAYHVYVTDGAHLTDPMTLAVGGLTALVLLLESPKLVGLLAPAKGRAKPSR